MKKFRITRTRLAVALACAAALSIVAGPGCRKDDPAVINGPQRTPQLPAQPYDYGFTDANTATLGRVLFYDPNLSLNNTISCGSCHKQQFAFGDNSASSRGLFNGMTSRNSSTLIAENGTFFTPRHKFWDGRAGSTDTAVFMPVMNELEMHMFDLNILPEKLKLLPYYPGLFAAAYGDPEITVARIRTALAAFVDALVTTGSKYDRGEMDAIALQGEDLFHDKARCYSCHNGQNFNGYETSYQNIGLEVNYSDRGRGYVTQNQDDYGKFTVPSLRNVEYSAPYMHDGRFSTLREVIDHYDHGVANSANLSWILRDIPETAFDSVTMPTDQNFSQFPVRRIGLTEQEKVALETFLLALSDPQFLSDPRYSDPFR